MLKTSLKLVSSQHRAPRTIDGLRNCLETVPGNRRAIAKLTIFVRTRGPNMIVFRDHHAVESACSYYLRVLKRSPV